MNSIDIFVQNYLSSVRTPFVTDFFYVLTSFFDVTNLASASKFIILVLCIIVLIYLVRNIKYSILFGLALFCATGIIYFLKIFFGVDRPADSVIFVHGQSFPSYHAAIATVFFVMLMYIFDPVVNFGITSSERAKPNAKIYYRVDSHLKEVARKIFNFTCILGIFLVALSRVYLGVHWLSDVLGGILLGVLLSYIAIFIFKKILKRK